VTTLTNETAVPTSGLKVWRLHVQRNAGRYLVQRLQRKMRLDCRWMRRLPASSRFIQLQTPARRQLIDVRGLYRFRQCFSSNRITYEDDEDRNASVAEVITELDREALPKR